MNTQVYSNHIVILSLMLIFLTVSAPIEAQMKEGTIYYNISLDINADGISEEEIAYAKQTIESKQFISFFNEDFIGKIETVNHKIIKNRLLMNLGAKEVCSFIYEYEFQDTFIAFQHLAFAEADERMLWVAIENEEANIEVFPLESQHVIAGYDCQKYRVLDKTGREYFFYLSDSVKLSYADKWNLEEHFNKLVVKVEIVDSIFTINILLDRILPGVQDTSWLSPDTTGMFNMNTFSEEFKELEEQMSGGYFEKVEPLQCLDNKGFVEERTQFVPYKPLLKADIPLILDKSLVHYSDEALKESIQALRECGLMSDTLFSKYQQLVNPEEASLDEKHYFFGTHAIDEALQVSENRQQIIQNLKVHGLLNKEHKEEIDQKFLTADIDFSEYLLEMDFIRPFPRLNDKVGFNEIPEIITKYFETIFAGQNNDFEVSLQYSSEQPEYLIIYGQEKYIVPMEELLPSSFFYTDEWNGDDYKRMPLPDSFIVTPELFTDMRNLGHQIAADIGQVIRIKHAKVSAYFNGFRENNDDVKFLQKHPEWSVFKHEYAIQIINQADMESAEIEVPIFQPLNDETNNTWLLHFAFYTQTDYPAKHLNSKKKQELSDLIGAEYPGINVHYFNKITLPVPADGNICNLLGSECQDYFIRRDANPHKEITEPIEFKDYFVHLHERLGGVFNATITAYEPTTGILTLETGKDRVPVQLGVHTFKFLELIDLINEQLAPEGKQFFLFTKNYPEDCRGILLNKDFLIKYLEICEVSLD